jgi:uncharacterized protein
LGKKATTKKVEVVFDTNIWVSLILNKQLAKSFKSIMENKERFTIHLSFQMLTELGRVLTYPKIANILKKSNVDPRVALGNVTNRVSLREMTEETVAVIGSDEPDNRVLECALESKASYIITGDRHLLDLKEFEGVKIVTARDFLSGMEVSA